MPDAPKRKLSKLQLFVIGFGVVDLILTAGYLFQMEWATDTWPWPVNPLDFILVSSFLAGATATILWLGFVGDWGAATGATMNVGSMNVGAAIFLYEKYAGSGDPRFLTRAIAFTVFALMNAAVFVWTLRHPIRDKRPASKVLRGLFVVFSGLLIFAAVQLMRQSPTIFPWPLEPDTEVMFGWLFLGSAIYFTYGLLRPSWHNMRGQLLAFLAYDLILIPPYTYLFPMVQPEHFTSLCVYMVVLVFSTVVSVYYLFIDKTTRRWTIQTS
jgi:hypothetical protein